MPFDHLGKVPLRMGSSARDDSPRSREHQPRRRHKATIARSIPVAAEQATRPCALRSGDLRGTRNSSMTRSSREASVGANQLEGRGSQVVDLLLENVRIRLVPHHALEIARQNALDDRRQTPILKCPIVVDCANLPARLLGVAGDEFSSRREAANRRGRYRSAGESR